MTMMMMTIMAMTIDDDGDDDDDDDDDMMMMMMIKVGGCCPNYVCVFFCFALCGVDEVQELINLLHVVTKQFHLRAVQELAAAVHVHLHSTLTATQLLSSHHHLERQLLFQERKTLRTREVLHLPGHDLLIVLLQTHVATRDL
jgi:hypothetical protein